MTKEEAILNSDINTAHFVGTINNIEHSHTTSKADFNKAILTVQKENGSEEIFNIVFKNKNEILNGAHVEFDGTIRSFSRVLESGKNKVDIYVYTDFISTEDTGSNSAEISGEICKIGNLTRFKNGTHSIQFIIKNVISSKFSNYIMKSYIPVVFWNELATEAQKFDLYEHIHVVGYMHSREYKKYVSEEEFEYRVAHEFVVTEIIPQ